MLQRIKNLNPVKRVRKTLFYSRFRQHFPMRAVHYLDDRDRLSEAEIVKIDWPTAVKKPFFGLVRDCGGHPKWTKFCRFLENNSFEYGLYDIHHHDWMEQAAKFDIVAGIPSNSIFHLQEMRSKYHVLEKYLGTRCYPSPADALLYEDKFLEAYISRATGIPFAHTCVSHDREDAMDLVRNLKYPFVSKIVPSSGSYGVELVRTHRQAERIVNEAFSRNGRKTHVTYCRQKDYVYFQEFIPNDGYDIRIIVVGNMVFGYYRKVPEGDFRASGMQLKERRELPHQAVGIARKVYEIVGSPLLAVDMVHGLDGAYCIVEFSPHYLMGYSDELRVNGVPGVYVFDTDGTWHFERGRYWVAELALREFLRRQYLPALLKDGL